MKARCGAVEHARRIPKSVGTHQQQRISVDGQRIGVRRDLAFDFDIIVIGKRERRAAWAGAKAHAPPKRRQPYLDIAERAAVAAPAREFDARAEQAAHHFAAAMGALDRDPLDFNEIGEPSKPHGGDRFAIDLGDEVGGSGEIIAVEFFVERTGLLAHIDKRAQRKHTHQCVQIARDLNAHAIGGRCAVEINPRRRKSCPAHEASSSWVSEKGGE